MARLLGPFLGWNRLETESTDIVVVHCGDSSPSRGNVDNGPASDFKVITVAVLKGETNVNSARLWTDYNLEPGEDYLVFGYYSGGIYQAYEGFRVVPLGKDFSTNLINGNTIEEKIQVLFRRRINDLNQQIDTATGERERLEEALTR